MDTNPIARPHRRTPKRRRLLALGGAVVLVAAFADAAGAHVGVTPKSVVAGKSATVRFTIGHGCAGSPTVKIEMKLPGSIPSAVPVAPKGWTGTVSGSVVSFTGTPIPATTKAVFGITFTAPAKAQTLTFPTIQRCTVGKNDWIQLPLPGGREPEKPAPTLRVR